MKLRIYKILTNFTLNIIYFADNITIRNYLPFENLLKYCFRLFQYPLLFGFSA